MSSLIWRLTLQQVKKRSRALRRVCSESSSLNTYDCSNVFPIQKLSKAGSRRHSPAGTLLKTFPPEIVDLIFSFMSIPCLLTLGALSSVQYIAVRNHIYRRSRDLIRPFVKIPDNMFALLRWTKSMVSGSSVLAFMMPSPKISWEPKDLDVYTPRGRSTPIVDFLTLEGYKEVYKWSTAPKPNGDYTRRPGIVDVITMTRGKLSIDIVESSSPSAFFSISCFHLTAVMNFVSGDGFFSAYPALTVSERALANRLAYSPQLLPPRKIIECYRKYERRGFTIANLPLHLELESDVEDIDMPHICHRSSFCPSTIRSTFDCGCLFVPFVKDQTAVIMDHKLRRVYHSRAGVVWNIGGRSCDGSYETLRPFTFMKG